ncbi:hypothetical protein HK104_009993 [Borealophlyctis nickersoniae]|nr:hypothetical protein HK104_009993 [Borealophlyctis nickersoniae]
MRWAEWMLRDDEYIRKDGVASLGYYELLEALEERGYIGLEHKEMPQLRAIMSGHLRFTKLLTDMALRKGGSAPKGRNSSLQVPTTRLEGPDLAAIGAMMVVGRALNLK